MKRTELEIRLLGPLEVLEDGGTVELPPSRKARALLAYLVATGRPHGRSALCDLFWAEVNDPRAGLRWALSKIRSVVDRDEHRRIVTSRDRVGFEPCGAIVDLHLVEEEIPGDVFHAPVGVLEDATRAFRGEFLEDLDLTGCHGYQAWCLGMRERLRRRHLAIRKILVERLDEDPDAALLHALARLRLEPLSEDAHIAAMDALGRLGRVDRGLELYERCRRLLAEDLGVSPSPELREARRRLRGSAGAPVRGDSTEQGVGGTVAPRPDGAGPSAAVLAGLPAPDGLPEPDPDEPALVGRARELDTLVRLARAAGSEGGRTTALIAGEPGIGKTRLLRELVREVRSAGGWALSGPVFESEEIRPYGPWIDLVRSLPREVMGDDLSDELSALLVAPARHPKPGGPVERAQLFEGVARLLQRLAEVRAPGLVVLDDVQWLDPSSASLLHYVARTLDAAPLLFALAAREEEMEEGSASLRTLRSLSDEGLLQRILLGRLDAPDTRSLVRAVAPAADAARIFETSEGNPLFALAIAASLGEGTDRTPATIQEELAGRLERLDRDARSVLSWAAALGRAFDVPTLVRVVDRPAPELVEAIDRLERRRILRATGPDRYDFTHSLLRQAAYGRLSEPARRAIHRSIARSLDDPEGPGSRVPAAVAHHAELGGLPELSVRACTEAAEHSLWLFAFDEAAELAARGLAQLEQLPDAERIPLEMGLLRLFGFRSMRDRRPGEVEERVRRVTEEARESGLTPVVAVGHATLMELEYQRGAFDAAARSSVSAAEAGREGDPAAAVRALTETATCLLLLDQAPEDARRLANEAFELAAEHRVEMDVLALARAFLHHHDGELEEALEAFAEVIRLGRKARDRWWECPALTRMAMVELDRGNPSAALDRSREAEELAERLGDETEAAFARGLGAVAAELLRLNEGEPRRSGANLGSGDPEGLDAADEALRELRLLDSLWAIGQLQAYAAEAELERERPEAARERAEEAARAARTIDQPSLSTLAEGLLARSSLSAGAARAPEGTLDPIRSARPEHLLSARARRALRRAREVAGGSPA